MEKEENGAIKSSCIVTFDASSWSALESQRKFRSFHGVSLSQPRSAIYTLSRNSKSPPPQFLPIIKPLYLELSDEIHFRAIELFGVALFRAH